MAHHLDPLIQQAADFIAQHQLSTGLIPWFEGSIADPWDHVECAIALDLAENHTGARRAYEWLRDVQNPDGSWWYSYLDRQPQERARDSNYCSYPAVGMWCHYLTTGDRAFLESIWPTIQRGLEFSLTLQAPTGEMYWSFDPDGQVWDRSLIGSSSCIWLSLRCGLKIAEALGHPKPQWEEASARLATAIRTSPDSFDIYGFKNYTFSMSWFYPVLSGVINGTQGKDMILGRWDDFVIDGWGCKCVAEAPYWVTFAESCELIIALARIGEHDRAATLMQWILQLQAGPGSFWSGIKIPEQMIWPEEKPTWASAAFIIAATQLKNRDRLIAKFPENSQEQSETST